jgi:rubredoxin
LKISKSKKQKGNAMARTDFGSLPHWNPCAQCGKPIAAPDWVEAGPHRTSYLWRCQACGYRFEAMAIFADSQSDQEAIAA